MTDPVIGAGKPVGPICAAALMIMALPACGDASSADRAPDAREGSAAAKPAPSPSAEPFYLATLARPREAYPEAGVSGTYRVRNGCAMLDDHLLVLPSGQLPAGSGPVLMIRPPDGRPKRLAPGNRVQGGGGYYPLDSLGRADTDLELVAPVPARCAAVASGAVLAAPIERVMSKESR